MMSVHALLLAAGFFLAAPRGALGAGGMTVTMPKPQLEAARDGDITLPCTYVSKEADQQFLYIIWSKQADTDEKPVIMYSGGRTSVPDESFNARVTFAADVAKGDVSIKITKLRNDDNGVYTCSVSILPGVDSGHVTLTVLVAPTKPDFTISGKAEFYQDVKIICTCSEGSPAPTFSWRRIDANGNIAVMSSPASASGTLELKNLTQLSSGTYECTATNKVGRTVTNGTLSVTYPQNNAMMYGIIIAAGIGGLLILVGIISYCVWRRNRKRREEEGYYSDEQYEMEGEEEEANEEKRGRRSPEDRDLTRDKYLAVSRGANDDRSERGGRRYRDDDRDYSDSESRRGNGDTGQRRNRRDRYSDESDDESRERQSRHRRDRDLDYEDDRDRDRARGRDRGRDRDRDRLHPRSRDLDDDRPYSRSRDHDLDHDLDKDRPYSRSRDRDLDRDLDKDRPYSRSRDRDLDRDLDKDRPYSRSRDRDLDRDLDKDRPYSRSRDRDMDGDLGKDRPYSRSRDRDLDRDLDRNLDKDRPYSRSRDRGLDRDDGSGFDDSHSEAASSTRDTRPRPPPNKPKIILDRIDAAQDV